VTGLDFVTQNDNLVGAKIANWYAIQTMSRHERLVTHQLGSQGLTAYLPSFTETHRWSDRRKKVELPLFPGYVFVNAIMSAQVRRVVAFTRGVAGFITMRGEPIPIPDDQIESVQRILANNIRCAAYPFLKVGQRVRVRGGALDGIQGILIADTRNKGLVVSIDSIQRALIVHIEGYGVEVI
jgi:transcription antitermination factor NusG